MVPQERGKAVAGIPELSGFISSGRIIWYLPNPFNVPNPTRTIVCNRKMCPVKGLLFSIKMLVENIIPETEKKDRGKSSSTATMN
jgi:hypothetical protein